MQKTDPYTTYLRFKHNCWCIVFGMIKKNKGNNHVIAQLA